MSDIAPTTVSDIAPATTKHNFCLPLKPFESDRLRLDVFDPPAHAESWVTQTSEHPELLTYLSCGPWQTVPEFLSWYNDAVEAKASSILFAIIVKSDTSECDERLAGVIALLDMDPENGRVEIGSVTILPAFQRSFVLTHATGLLLKYLLDPVPEGMGFRRVQWQAQTQNAKSVCAAERLGFTFEGTTRWQRVLRDGKAGEPVNVARAKGINGTHTGPGRHQKVFAMCWDDWEEGKKEHIVKLMSR